jgi:hypothetical protein
MHDTVCTVLYCEPSHACALLSVIGFAWGGGGGAYVAFLLVEVWLFITWSVSDGARPLLSILGFVLPFCLSHSLSCYSDICTITSLRYLFLFARHRGLVGKQYRKETAVWVPV